MIVEYMLEQVGRSDARRTPPFIREGGQYFNPNNFTYLGWVPNLAAREFYIPDTLTTITRSSIVTRNLEIHANYPMQKADPDNEGMMINMTDAEVTADAEAWWDSVTDAHAQKAASAEIEYAGEAINVIVYFTNPGLIVTGSPQLAVDVSGASKTLAFETPVYKGLRFTLQEAQAEGAVITVSTASSISLNGGTITDGTEDVALSLSGIGSNVTYTV